MILRALILEGKPDPEKKWEQGIGGQCYIIAAVVS
jgi:hypothetical protein